MATEHAPVYKLKRVDFFGRTVPIALQNENGPCPLLAIANVLLLRKQIELPEHAPDISQNRLVSLVAGHLLDSNDEHKLGKNLPEGYKANLRKNVSDAMAILAKLTTGIDVNVRFHHVKAFEFTNEISIFDLVDISLVHGWLVDPQDIVTAATLGQRSYNEVVEQLILLLGDATPKRLLTPQLSRHTSGLSTPRRSTSSLKSSSLTASTLPSAFAAAAGVTVTPHAQHQAPAPPTDAPTAPAAGTSAGALPPQRGESAPAAADAVAADSLSSGSAWTSSAAAQPPSPADAPPSPQTTPPAAQSPGVLSSVSSTDAADALSTTLMGAPASASPTVSGAGISMDTAGTTPMGAIVNAPASSIPKALDPAPAEGPLASLVSAQLTAPPSHTYTNLAAPDEDQLALASYLQPPSPLPAPLSPSATQADAPQQHQVQHQQPPLTQLVSPAAALDVQQQQQQPGSSSPGTWDEDITPQTSSVQVDGHIAAAPTPYPSLTTGWSQPTPVQAPDSSQAGVEGHMSALSQALEAAAAQSGVQSSSPTHHSPQRTAATASAAGKSARSAAGQALMPAKTNISGPDIGPGSESEAEEAPVGLDLAALKLDEADAEQLQAALVLSLGQGAADSTAGQLPNVSFDSDSSAGRQAASGTHSASDAQTAEGVLSMMIPALASGQDVIAASASTGLGASLADAPQRPPQHQHSQQAGSVPAPDQAEQSSDLVQSVSSESEALTPALKQKSGAAADCGPGAAGAGSSSDQTTFTGQERLEGADPGTQGTGSSKAGPEKAHEGSLDQAGVLSPQASGQPSGLGPQTRQHSGAGSRRSTMEGEQQSKNAAEAHIIQDFLDGTSSQLTEHGLSSLQEGLRPNELAVFFRNNHFNTVFLHKGALHLLVTDQGYEYEKHVVWERLDNVMGNTQFLKADFMPYGETSLAEQVSGAADLMQAAFAGVASAKTSAATESVVDADYAFALQLQEEEQRSASQHQHQQPRQHQQHHQQQQHSSSRGRTQAASLRQDPGTRAAHARPPSGRSSAQAFANPMMQQGSRRPPSAAQPQQPEKATSAIAKFFGWGKK